MQNRLEFTDFKFKKNYLSVDQKTAISSYGEIYEVGEEVGHDANELELAVIQSFELNTEKNEVKVQTDRGYAHLDFLRKV